MCSKAIHHNYVTAQGQHGLFLNVTVVVVVVDQISIFSHLVRNLEISKFTVQKNVLHSIGTWHKKFPNATKVTCYQFIDF